MNGKALGAIELKPEKFYDYKAKYYEFKTLYYASKYIKKKYNQVLKISEKAHKALNCRYN